MQQLDFSHESDLDIDILERRVAVYYPDADFVMLRKAFNFASKSHAGQKRSSGEDFIIHPINVAASLIKLHLDLDSIIAGLLHDTIEDCDVSAEEIEREFSKNIAEIVIGLTKISKINFKTKEESQAENFRKMVVAMAKDIRVIIVKLADRMHNMRTLQYVSEAKQKKIAQETLDIYVPLANRLGINSVKGELEDLCLRYLKPEVYYRLAEKVEMKKSERDRYIKNTVHIISDTLQEYSLKAEVKGRSKHFYSIYKKIVGRGVEFDQIQDILAFRIIVNNITECYKALGIIHSKYMPIPGRFKDFIAIPKVNNYQSLHSTVIGPKAERIEVQIRTVEMDQVAETGVAAHWKYKEGLAGKKTKLDWVQELLEFNQDLKSNSDFMDVVKNNMDTGGIFIFTPTGDVVELGYEATPLDFAFSIHSEVGSRCVGAKVNGKMVPLRFKLKSGDTVEILTSKTQTPSKDWLNIVKTSRAKTKIKQWLLKFEREKSTEAGREILEKAFRVYGVSFKNVKKMEDYAAVCSHFKIGTDEDLFLGVGVGKISARDFIESIPSLKNESIKDDVKNKIKEIDTYSKKLVKQVRSKSNKDNAIIVDGMSDLVVRVAKCCNPIPGDSIIGYVTRGRGITVHTGNCKRVKPEDMVRSIAVEWNTEFAFKHPVNIRVITLDKPGVLTKLSTTITGIGMNITGAIAKTLPDSKGSFIFEFEVKDYSELIKVINTLEAMEEVISVIRV